MSGEKAVLKKRNVGVLAPVTTPEDVRPEDYVDSLNIINDADQEDEEGYDNSDRPILGNEFAYSVGSVSAQNKKYRIYMPYQEGSFDIYNFSFLSPSGAETFLTVSFQNNNYSDPWNVLAATLQSAASANPNHPMTFTPNSGGWVDVTYSGFNYVDWWIRVSGTYTKIVVTQEAIDKSLEGDLVPFHATLPLGEKKWVFSTTRERKRERISASVIGVGLGAPTSMTFNADHGLSVGEAIAITHSNHAALNGTWIVASVPSPTQITIITDTSFGGTIAPYVVGQERIFKNVTQIGEIGLAVKDLNDGSWDYTRMIRTTDFDFVLSTEFDKPKAEENSFRTAIYWTDNNDFPRAIYYEGDIVQDGFIQTENESGLYYYRQIDIPSRHLLPLPDSQVDFVESVTGGKLPPGNKRYVTRLLLQNLVASDYSDVSGVVSVYSSGGEAAYNNRMGDPDGGLTDMAIRIKVTGLNPLTHRFVEIVAINYGDGSISAERVARLTIEADEIEYLHTGLEKGVNVDVGSIPSLNSYVFDYARTMNLMDQRALFSSLREEPKDDLSPWAKTFQHRIVYKKIYESRPWLDGEYEVNHNVFGALSFMINETRRFGVRLRNKRTRKWTDVFWIDDIRVDPRLTNTANANDDRRDQTGFDLLGNYDLTVNNGPTDKWVKVPHVEFFGFDLDYMIDGIPLRQKYDRMEIMPAERVPEIVANGWGVYCARIKDHIPLDIGPYTSLTPEMIMIRESNENLDIVEFPWWAQGTMWSFVGPQHSTSVVFPALSPNQTDFLDTHFLWNSNTPNQNTSGSRHTMTTELHRVCLHVPEHIYGKLDVEQINRGKVKLRVFQGNSPERRTLAKNDGKALSHYVEMFAQGLGSYNDYGIRSVREVQAGESVELGDGVFRRALDTNILDNTGNFTNGSDWGTLGDYWKNPRCLLLEFDVANYPQVGANIASFYCQLVFEDIDRQGDKETTIYQTHGAVYDIPRSGANITAKGQYKVFGDMFINGLYYQTRYMNEDWRTDITGNGNSWDKFMHGGPRGKGPGKRPGFGGGVRMWTQQWINTILRYDTEDQYLIKADTQSVIDWLEKTDSEKDQYTYSDIYNIVNNVTTAAAFVNSLKRRKDMLVRFQYSDPKIADGQTDGYRDIKVGNLKDLDLTDGIIVHHDDIRGELFVWQERRFIRMFFNTNGILQTSEGQDINIREGGVLDRKGIKLSQYGCQHKFSIIRGRSAGGKDVYAWINMEHNTLVRYGADGTVDVSEKEDFTEVIKQNFKWAADKHEPFLDQGIRGVWDQRFKEFRWTVTGRKTVNQWVQNTGIFLVQTLVGTVVTNSNQAVYSEFERTPDLFRCIVGHVATANTEPAVGSDWETYWEVIPRSDKEYYSEFTLALSERRSGFSTYYTPKPTTYFQFGDSFLSPRPGSRKNRVYEHHRGKRTTWYEFGSTLLGNYSAQVADAYRTFVFAMFHEESKNWIGIRLEAFKAPTRVEFKTPSQESYLNENEFVELEGKFVSRIKNDSTGTGNNEADTRRLYGKHIFVKVITAGGEFNRIGLIQIKCKLRPRSSKT